MSLRAMDAVVSTPASGALPWDVPSGDRLFAHPHRSGAPLLPRLIRLRSSADLSYGHASGHTRVLHWRRSVHVGKPGSLPFVGRRRHEKTAEGVPSSGLSGVDDPLSQVGELGVGVL